MIKNGERMIAMSILKFIFKPKREMAKPKTRRINLFGFVFSSHAQNRIADPKRNISKTSVIVHFGSRPLATSEETISRNDGTKEFRRYGSKLTSVVSSNGQVVKTLWRNNKRECRKMGLMIANKRTRLFAKQPKSKARKKDK